jgi:membrane protease YdiL (CAAX protease family)
MKYGIFNDAHPLTKLVMVGFLMVTSYFIILGLSIIIASLAFGAGWDVISELLEIKNFDDHVALLKFLQMGYSTGLFLVPALLGSWLISGKAFDYLLLNRPSSVSKYILVLLLMFSAIPLINLLARLNYSIPIPESLGGIRDRILESEQDSELMMDTFLNQESVKGLLVNLLMIALIPSLGEEFLFRGLIQRIFAEWTRNHHAGVWIGAVFFSLMHFQYYGFIPRILLGACFGYMLVWGRSMWLPVVAHFINNGVAVVFFHFYFKGKIKFDLDNVGTMDETYLYTLVSVVLVILFMSLLYAGRGND